MTTAIATTVRVRPLASSSVSECDNDDDRSDSATIAATIAATAAAAAATTSTAMSSSCCYETIVDDLCRRLETSGYYTPKSSPWFLRGAMGKHEERFNRANATVGSFRCRLRLRFRTEAFTDVLVARVMGGPSQTAKDPITTKTTTKTTGEEEHSNENGETRDNDEDDESDNQNENENETRGALNANDDESDEADNNNNSNNNSNSNNNTNTTNNDNNDNNDNKENGNNTDDGDHPRRNAKPTTTPADSCLLVTKALLRGDPGKYLPAITASLSAWTSSVVAGNSNSNADPISPAVVKFWVSLLVDPSAPLELHDRLSNALLDVITVTVVVVAVPDSRSPSWSPAALPSTREFLEAVISEPVFSLSGPTLLPSSLSSSSSSSSSSVIRRASFAIRFLSRSCCSALPRSDRNALVRALETSGALKWLTGVLSTGTGDDNNSNSNSNSNNDNDNDYHGRLRLLDVLLEECECGCECRPVSGASDDAGFVPWVTLLASLPGLSPVLSDFVRDTCRRLVEEWGHQWSNPEGGAQSAHGCVSGYVSASEYVSASADVSASVAAIRPEPARNNQRCATATATATAAATSPPCYPLRGTSHELASQSTALACAKRFLRVLSRLALPLSSSEATATATTAATATATATTVSGRSFDGGRGGTVDWATLRHGMRLVASMLRDTTVPLQQLRLVRLVTEEFGNHHSNAVRMQMHTCLYSSGGGIIDSSSNGNIKNNGNCNSNSNSNSNNNPHPHGGKQARAICDWLSSPAVLAPVQHLCTEDPVLFRSEAARRYLATTAATISVGFGSPRPERVSILSYRKLLRDAPPCRAIRDVTSSPSGSLHSRPPPSGSYSRRFMEQTSTSTLTQTPITASAASSACPRRSPLAILRNWGDLLHRNGGSHHRRPHPNYVLFDGINEGTTIVPNH